MEINLPNFKKSFTGPIPDHYAEIDIPTTKLKPGEVMLLDGPSTSSKRVFMDVIRGEKPSWSENEMPTLNYAFKQQVLSSKEQFETINKILGSTNGSIGDSPNIYIFDEPSAFLRDEEASYISTLISEFIIKNKKIGIIS